MRRDVTAYTKTSSLSSLFKEEPFHGYQFIDRETNRVQISLLVTPSRLLRSPGRQVGPWLGLTVGSMFVRGHSESR